MDVIDDALQRNDGAEVMQLCQLVTKESAKLASVNPTFATTSAVITRFNACG